MPAIKENLEKINREIQDTALSCRRNPDDIQLIAVSKRKSVETVKKGIKAGAINLGENYIQEAIQKINIIGKKNACWHFIGHLQSNKAKIAVKYFEYIHTVDTFKLAGEINKQAEKIDKIQKILLQVNISEEKTKSGTGIKDAIDLAKQISIFKNIYVQGLMCMPPFFSDPEQARPYFQQLFQIKEEISAHHFKGIQMDHLSMGMSNDFKVAIEEGSTMVRVGTSIFGKRD